jgi:hypothetical protein
MSNKGFGNSIGGARGSGSIDTTSIGLKNASGTPVTGYKPSKEWGGQGAPCPENGAGLANTQMSSRKPSK